MAVPSFSDLVKKNRISTQTNEFVGSLVLARMEAIKRKANIDVIPNETDHWGNGWVVRVSGGEIIQTFSPFKGGTLLNSTDSRNVYQFGPNGRVNGSDTLTLCLPDSDLEGRSIAISNTGRISTQNTVCS